MVAVIGYVTLVELIMISGWVTGTPIQVILRLPLLLFLPGYVLVSIGFPTAYDPDKSIRKGIATDAGFTLVERCLLSFGMSVALMPVFGLFLTGIGLRMEGIVGLLPIIIILGAIGATIRGNQILNAERYSFNVRDWVTTIRRGSRTRSPRQLLTNGALALSILLAFSTIAFAVAAPPSGASYSGFYLLTETDDGKLVADNYPTEFVQGESNELIVGIENGEGETIEYTVVVELQRVNTVDNEVLVFEREEVSQFTVEVSTGEVHYETNEIEPTLLGSDLRLSYYLYIENVPENPDRETAHRDLHLWVDVDASTGD